MKTNIVAAILLSGVTGVAGAADCTTSPQLPDAASALEGMLVCGSSASGDTWQEEHHAGGLLREYAKGSRDPVDP